MTTLDEVLAALPSRAERWVLPAAHDRCAPEADARALLESLPEDDRRMLDLVYGLGLDVGTASYALGTDPSVIVWRLRQIFAADDGPELEAATSRLLRAGDAARCAGADDAHVAACSRCRVARLPEEMRRRLGTRLVDGHPAGTSERAAGGLGIGSALVILLFVLAFIVFGYRSDRDPFWQGQRALAEERWEAGRRLLEEALRTNPTTRTRLDIAVSWLGEGDFDAALAWIAEHPDLIETYGDFLPGDIPIEPLAAPENSAAVLPRGLITVSRPDFLVEGGAAGVLTLTVVEDGESRNLDWPLPASAAGADWQSLPYPEPWPDLPGGEWFWSVRRGGEEPRAVAVSLASAELRNRIRSRQRQVVSHLTARVARHFFLGHYFLRRELLTQAAYQFGSLARNFPEADYPREMLERIAAALRVDPSCLMQ